jgi:hypothetical protein
MQINPCNLDDTQFSHSHTERDAFLCPNFGHAQTLLAGGISGVRLPRVMQVAFVIASLAQRLRRGEQQSKKRDSRRKNHLFVRGAHVEVWMQRAGPLWPSSGEAATSIRFFCLEEGCAAEKAGKIGFE